MMEGRSRTLVMVLVAIIVILLAIVVYAFVVRPTINGYVVNGQNQGVELAVVSIMQRAAPPNCQVVPLTYQNQTVNVVAVECLQAPQPQ